VKVITTGSCAFPWPHRAIVGLMVAVLLLTSAVPARAQSQPLPEPYTDLYVVYNTPEPKTFSIEITGQRRHPDGSVDAAIAIRAESLIAYDLEFQQHKTSGTVWEDIDFLPLYPEHTYELASINFEPGGYFTVRGAKFSHREENLTKMTVVQMAILVMHLVGARPPAEWREAPEAVADSFSIVWGPVGAIASGLSALLEMFRTEKDVGKVLTNIGLALGDIPRFPELIASIINLMVKQGPQVTGAVIKNVFAALNVLNLVGNAKRAVDAFDALKSYPDPVEATITLAPVPVTRPARYRVLELGESYQTTLMFHNVGGEPLDPEKGYEMLVLSSGLTIGRVPLARFIRIGEQFQWSIPQIAPPIPGIYQISYQMAIQGVPIGPLVPGEIVVVPRNSGSLTGAINALVEDALRKAGDRFDEVRRDLERRITEAIVTEINRRLEIMLTDLVRRLNEFCGGASAALLWAVGAVWIVRRRRRQDGDR
jgi:hypothetical protein